MGKNTLLPVILILCLTGYCSADGEDWPTFKQNTGRTGFQQGYSNYSLEDITLIWNYTVGSAVESSPVVSDFDGDGRLNVVFGSDDGNLYCLDYQGKEIWNYSVGARIRSTPTLADLNLDDKIEVLFGADDGVLYVLDGNGKLLWSFTTNKSILSSPLAANFDDSKDLEIIVTSMDGFVYALNSRGESKWSYETSDSIRTSPAVGDPNDDDNFDVIFGSSNNVLYVLSYPPYRIWQYQTNGNIYATPAVVDYDRDYKEEIILASSDSVIKPIYWGTAISSAGKRKVCRIVDWREVCEFVTPAYSKLYEEWNYTTSGSIYSSPSVADFTGNSKQDIVFGTDKHTLHIINTEGQRIGGYTTNKAIKSTPAIADLDGDGIPEIIFGSDEGMVYVIDYPYIASLSTIVANLSFEELYLGLSKLGGKAEEMALEVGINETVETVSEQEWNILKTLDNKTFKKGSIKYLEMNRKVEISVGESKITVDARKNGNNIVLFNYPNKKRFSFKTEGTVRSSPAIADVNSDGHLEFFVGSSEGVLWAFGSLKEFTRSEAGDLLDEAEYLYSLDYYNATYETTIKAQNLYESIGDSQGMSRAQSILLRLEADEILAKALDLYNKSLIANASDYLDQAAMIYANINYTRSGENTSRLSDLLEAELYYREAKMLYNTGDLENASRYVLKAHEIFTAYNDTRGKNKSTILLELSVEQKDADAYYVLALNLFFEEGYSENVTEYLNIAKLVYEDVNASGGVVLVEKMLSRVIATKLTDNAYEMYEQGNIEGAFEASLNASKIFSSINYAPGLYRAESMANKTGQFIKASQLFEQSVSLYSNKQYAQAIDIAEKSREIYDKFNDTASREEVDKFIEKMREQYFEKVKKPKYLIILLNIMVGAIAGIMLIYSIEKLLKNKRGKIEEKETATPPWRY